MALNKSSNDSDGTSLGQDNDELVGMHGSKTARPTITGSRGGNSTLTNLLASLDLKGLIIDSTTN